MAEDERVITAKLPGDLVDALDKWAERMDRSKSWIVRQALKEWIAEEERRYQLTLEALASCDAGDTIPHEEVLARVAKRTAERRAGSLATSKSTAEE